MRVPTTPLQLTSHYFGSTINYETSFYRDIMVLCFYILHCKIIDFLQFWSSIFSDYVKNICVTILICSVHDITCRYIFYVLANFNEFRKKSW